MIMTTVLPEPLGLVMEIIQEKIEISPESDRVLTLSLWDFRNKNGDLIPKDDLKKVFRLLKEKKLLQIIDISCLDKLGRFRGEVVKVEVNREKSQILDDKTRSKEEIVIWRDLKINLSQGTMQYKNKKPIEISPTQDEIKYLVLLMESDHIVKYGEIADKLDLNCRASSNPKEIATAVQYIRRNIVPILVDAGITRDEIEDMILSKRNVGCKLFRP